MKWQIVLIVGALGLVGCQSSEPPATEAAAAPVVRKVTEVGEPTTDPTKIGLVIRRGPAITVGYPMPDKLFESFKDSKYSGSEYNDLPTAFKSPYKARSWETAHSGFGEITYDGVLVAAMYQEDKVSQDRVDAIVAEHKDHVDLLPTIYPGKKVTYWFWEVEGQRLMICAFQTSRQATKLTVAMGDDKVLDALGISPAAARRDLPIIDGATGQPQAVLIHSNKPQG